MHVGSWLTPRFPAIYSRCYGAGGRQCILFPKTDLESQCHCAFAIRLPWLTRALCTQELRNWKSVSENQNLSFQKKSCFCIQSPFYSILLNIKRLLIEFWVVPYQKHSLLLIRIKWSTIPTTFIIVNGTRSTTFFEHEPTNGTDPTLIPTAGGAVFPVPSAFLQVLQKWKSYFDEICRLFKRLFEGP